MSRGRPPLHAMQTSHARVSRIREILVDDRTWFAGIRASEASLELLFVPADGPVGARPRRASTHRPLEAITDGELVELQRAAV